MFDFIFLIVLIVDIWLVEGQIGNTFGNTYHPQGWTLQAELRVKEAGDTYGITPVGFSGRGFHTMITGYDLNDPGIYVHTNDDGHADRGHIVWTQQAKLKPDDGTSTDHFGKWIVSEGHTILVGSAYEDSVASDAGAVYVFNGTLRHWTQVQKLTAADGSAGDNFGTLLSLHNDRVVISSPGSVGAAFDDSLAETSTVGAAYVYERSADGVLWSRTSKLYAKDMAAGNYFGEHVGVYDDWVVSTSRNDALTHGTDTKCTRSDKCWSGSAYMFKQINSRWSQQQRLMAADLFYWQPGRDYGKYETTLGQKVFANDISLSQEILAAGIRREDDIEQLTDGVYIFHGYSETNRWSLQQRLFASPNDTGATEWVNSTNVKIFDNSLVASVAGPALTENTYFFKTFGDGWSLQQKLTSTNAFTEVNASWDSDYSGYNGSANGTESLAYSLGELQNPMLWGGHLIHKFKDSNLIHSRVHNGSCLLIWMSDHFLDGWDSAVLTVRAPDTTNDTFHPHCDQVDPFFVRYCPYKPEDQGVYIIRVFQPQGARFYWELSWQVQVEDTGEWYRGDYMTKMRFNYNATSMAFNFFDAENLIDLNRPCYRCINLARSSWGDQQIEEKTRSFWPLDAVNAPYYVSDYEGRTVYAMGNICDGVNTYQCYQRLEDGYYILRLGGGLFGRLTGLPYTNATWSGCGAYGTDRDQFVFRIKDKGKVCEAVQVTSYTDRCTRPGAIDRSDLSGTSSPTAGGTVAPTINVFGEPYVADAMYGYRRTQAEDGLSSEDPNIDIRDYTTESQDGEPQEISLDNFF